MIARIASNAACALLLFLTLTIHEASAQEDGFGAWTNPTGEPIGGGVGYSRIVTDGDFTVSTAGELVDALGEARPGQVVFVESDAVIDMSDYSDITIPGGVTLASRRDGEQYEGAILYSVDVATRPLFKTGGLFVRISGLRLRGPDLERRTMQLRELMRDGGRTSYYAVPNSNGIIASHSGLEVDNCELWGWSHAAVFLREGAENAFVHHSYIHHNQRSGLGYGVCLDRSNAIVEGNLFDWCRHHIAGTGAPGTSYEARYNVVFGNANGHSFDMHGGRDRGDDTDIAGDIIRIHHNMFMATDVAAVVIRGVPREKAEIHHNWFLHDDPDRAVRQTNAQGNLETFRNQYAPARIVKD